MSDHAKYSPSAAERWLNCAGSITVDTSMVDDSNADADRGTFLHGQGEGCLRSGASRPAADLPVKDFESVMTYVNYVRSRPGAKTFEDWGAFIEGLCSGTADSTILAFNLDELEVVDYKAGGSPVYAKENPQLGIYGLAMMRKYRALLPDLKLVRLTIVQPARMDEPDTWEVTPSLLEAMGANIQKRIEEIESGDSEFHPGPWCKWCKVPRTEQGCPALNEAAHQAAREDFGIVEKTMSWEEKNELANRVDAWCKSVRAEVYARVMSGQEIKGFKMVRGNRKRSWGDRKQAKSLLESWGYDERDIYTEPEFRSPAQAENLLKTSKTAGSIDAKTAKERKAELGECVTVVPGATTVVPDTDRRAAISKADLAREDFADDIEPKE